jgi:hypothetical protein
MAKTQTERKNNWNNHRYERVALVVKAGERERLKAAANADSISVNKLIIDSINAQRPGLLSPLDDISRQKKEPEAETE